MNRSVYSIIAVAVVSCCCVIGSLIALSVLKDTCFCSDRPLQRAVEDGEDDDEDELARMYDAEVMERGAAETMPVPSRLDAPPSQHEIATAERQLLRMRATARASDQRLAHLGLSQRERSLHASARISTAPPPPQPPPPQHPRPGEHGWGEAWGAAAAEEQQSLIEGSYEYGQQQQQQQWQGDAEAAYYGGQQQQQADAAYYAYPEHQHQQQYDAEYYDEYNYEYGEGEYQNGEAEAWEEEGVGGDAEGAASAAGDFGDFSTPPSGAVEV